LDLVAVSGIGGQLHDAFVLARPGKPASHTLMDQVWLSPALKPKQTGAFIDRRTRLSGDGGDHDPSWVTLNLP
jgi:hypothetical protein